MLTLPVAVPSKLPPQVAQQAPHKHPRAWKPMAKGPSLPALPQRLYRWVHWHSQRKLWVVGRRGEASPGSSATQAGAAKIASRAFGVALISLKLHQQTPSHTEPQERRKYKHIHWHKRSNVWVVQRKGFPSAGSSKSQLTAAKLAAKEFQVSVADLRLQLSGASRTRHYKHVHYHKTDPRLGKQ